MYHKFTKAFIFIGISIDFLSTRHFIYFSTKRVLINVNVANFLFPFHLYFQLHEHSRTKKDDKTAYAATSNNPSTSRKGESREGDSDAEDNINKISLGSVSSDSLSISHNKNDEDDDDDESEVLSNSLQSDHKKSSGTMSREDSLENQAGDLKESIEEEIVEEIIEELVENSTEKSLPDTKDRKRTLFNLDDNDETSVDREIAKKFGIKDDSDDISIGNIAQESKQKTSVPVLKLIDSSIKTDADNKRKSTRDADSLEEAPNSLESSSSSKENVEPGGVIPKSNKSNVKSDENKKDVAKELSPLQEDVILINNNKVSLNILKQLQAASQDNSLNNTTNDISDLAKDTFTQYSNAETSRSQQMPKETQSLHEDIFSPDVSARGFNSLGTAVPYKLPVKETHSVPASISPSMSCGEEDKSIEEMIIENSIEISSKSCVLEDEDAVEHTDIIKQNIDFEFKTDENDEKSENVEKSGDSPENLKEKILRNSATFAELQLQRQAEGTSNVIDENSPIKSDSSTDEPSIKKMQRADTFTKEPLDDISEEGSLPEDTSKLIEKGSIMRRILEQNITKRGEITNQTLSSDVLNITTSTINTTTTTTNNETQEAVNDAMRVMVCFSIFLSQKYH